jgi:adenylate cyclase
MQPKPKLGHHFQFLFSRLLERGADPQDEPGVRLQKRLLCGASALVIVATTLWGVIYLVFHEPVAGAISLGYAAVTLVGLLLFDLRRAYMRYLSTQLLMGLLLPFLQMVALGGFNNSGAVILWSIISAMGALFFYDFRQAIRWWLAYFTLLIFTGLMQPFVRAHNNLPPDVISAFFVMNISGVSVIVLSMLSYFIRQKDEAYRLLHIEQEKGEALLLNILPRKIADILKNDERTIADAFEGASVLFADLVGFTPLTAEQPPVVVVNLLNEIFTQFDYLVEKYQVEKIRTIGDNYMVASGVPSPRSDHAQALACLALDMSAYLRQRPSFNGRRVEFRIGINSGPVIGGVIGRRKFVYDVWGDAVNIASRMESQGLAGRVQIAEATYQLIAAEFECEPRGPIPVKGRGEMNTYLLVRRKTQAEAWSAELNPKK